MKFILSLLMCLFLSSTYCFAVEEVILDVDDNSDEVESSIEDKIIIDNAQTDINSTFKDKILKIKNKKYEDNKKTSYLFDEILTKNFESGPLETMHLIGYYRGSVNFDFSEDFDSDYSYNAIHTGINGKFRGSETYYEAKVRLEPRHGYSFWQSLPADIYIANASIPHQRIILGNTRTPNGVEGSRSDSIIPFVARAQIARNFGNIRKFGLRVKGRYDLFEYDLGGYSSDTYFRKFFPGAEFSGWITFKPLGKTDGKFGKMILGTGITSGKNDINYDVYGFYVGYEYKKLFANFEYAYADGYNGSRTISNNKAEGFYTTLGYNINPKVQLLARYDEYTPNTDIGSDVRREYSTGINYFIKGQALKLMLNYVFCQNDMLQDSHRIILGTQLNL